MTANSAKTACEGTCGDSITVTGEDCDDGNTSDEDGCSSTCKLESNSYCINNGSSADTCTV